MPIPIYQVDAFTGQPFRGNPAGVCLLDAPRPDEWMQSVAREMNLAETAFIIPENDAYRLRWFTPAVEVELCGHATLATAHVLWESGRLAAAAPAHFHTLSGLLIATLQGERIQLDFPATPVAPAADPGGLADALGVVPVFTGKTIFDYFVVVDGEDAVREARPDVTRLGRMPGRGVILTARGATAGYDFVSRFFAPQSGIPEDPVTGSAHCALGPYWAGQLGKTSFHAHQASARGGELWVELAGERVLIRGQAVTVLEGLLRDG